MAVLRGALVLTMLMPGLASAQRDFQRTIGETVFDRVSPHYRFESFVHASADGERRWRVRIAIPTHVDAEQPRPSIWMLDGNAALMLFDDALLAELAQRNAPVLVFVGPDNERRVDTAQRWRDLTPTATPAGKPRRHLDGGADTFLEALERGIGPEVARRVTLDPQQQVLWGHSLGGLFVLHTLFQRSGLFHTYVAASPSLWWHDGVILRDAERFAEHNAGHRARVWIMLGDDERGGHAGNLNRNNPRDAAYLAMISTAGPEPAASLAHRLSQVPGLQVGYRTFPGLGHGPALRASLMATLHSFSGVADRSATSTPSPVVEASKEP